MKKTTIADPVFGLRLMSYVNFYDQLNYLQSNGFCAIIRIGNNSYSTDFSNGGILVSAGFQTHISINREFKYMLPKPYSNCEIDTDSSKFIDGFDVYNLISQSEYEYTQQLCFSQCYQKHFINRRNCSSLHLPSLNNVSQCDDDIKYGLNYSANFLNLCLTSCPLECYQTLYKCAVSSHFMTVSRKYIELIKSNSKIYSDFYETFIENPTNF